MEELTEIEKNCPAKHTKFQPSMQEWRCPKCGSDSDKGFVIDDHPDSAFGNCGLLHEEDDVVCEVCEGGWSGKKVAQLIATKLDKKPCPCCKGEGYMSSAKASRLAELLAKNSL
jgi:Zn finger protein HypA/HybF involved in hydrogenase expression